MATGKLMSIRHVVCLMLLLSSGVAHLSLAQESALPLLRDRGSQSDDPLAQFRQRLQQSSAAGAGIPMEGAVDADEYVVGPGDLFSVSIGGPQPAAVVVSVSADGRLVLPEGATVPAAGRTLAVVRQDALEALERRYRNVSVGVALVQPRQFYVHVAGAVPVPGRYLAVPVARVSDVLQLAFMDTTSAPVSNRAYRPSLRNIQLARRSGDVVQVDLARYMSTGEVDSNPYLRDGDIINVAAYSVSERAVFINGAVPFPGAYDFRPGDTIVEVLRVAGVGPSFSDIGTVRVARQLPDGSVQTWMYAPDEIRGSAGSMPLQALDHVSVEESRRNSGTAEIEGYVRFPGRYAIEPGRTTLKDLVELAGGFRSDALIRGAFVVRNVLPEPEPSFSRQNRFEAQMLDVSVLRTDTLEIMRYLRQSDLEFMSRTQFAQGLRIQNRISVDVAAALEPDAPPVILHDNDKLVVPHDKRSVFVFGQVHRPGFVQYEPNLSAEQYIARVGGRNELGRNAYVVEAGTGRYLDARTAAIDSGDLIFVDSRVAVADNAELQRLVLEENRARAQHRMQWIQAVTQTVFSLASLITVYVTLRNR